MRALSLEELSACLARKKRPTQFFQYKELPDDPGELALLLLTHPARFLFHVENKNCDVGHWTALVRRDNHICWFSSYGFLPDGELMISADLRKAPGQHFNKISKALHYLHDRGYIIHFCSVPLQRIGDNTVSCGIWCLAFLTSRIQDFEQLERKLASITVPEAYAEKIFQNEFGGDKQ
jgi:hypothetical protein